MNLSKVIPPKGTLKSPMKLAILRMLEARGQASIFDINRHLIGVPGHVEERQLTRLKAHLGCLKLAGRIHKRPFDDGSPVWAIGPTPAAPTTGVPANIAQPRQVQVMRNGDYAPERTACRSGAFDFLRCPSLIQGIRRQPTRNHA